MLQGTLELLAEGQGSPGEVANRREMDRPLVPRSETPDRDCSAEEGGRLVATVRVATRMESGPRQVMTEVPTRSGPRQVMTEVPTMSGRSWMGWLLADPWNPGLVHLWRRLPLSTEGGCQVSRGAPPDAPRHLGHVPGRMPHRLRPHPPRVPAAQDRPGTKCRTAPRLRAGARHAVEP